MDEPHADDERLTDRFGWVWRRSEGEVDVWESDVGAGLYWSRTAIEEHHGPVRQVAKTNW